MRELSKEEIEALSPGIRNAVLWFRAHGFETTDSGDGSNAEAGMEGAMSQPMVAVTVRPSELLEECDRIARLFVGLRIPIDARPFPAPVVQIQGSYDPADNSAVILVTESGAHGHLRNLQPPLKHTPETYAHE